MFKTNVSLPAHSIEHRQYYADRADGAGTSHCNLHANAVDDMHVDLLAISSSTISV